MGLAMPCPSQRMSREPSTPSLMGPAWDKLCKWSRTLWSRARLTYVCVLVTQSCLTLCDPMDCSPPSSSVHRILQARILEWVPVPSSWGSSQTRDQTQASALQADSLLSETPGKPSLLFAVFSFLEGPERVTLQFGPSTLGFTYLHHLLIPPKRCQCYPCTQNRA